MKRKFTLINIVGLFGSLIWVITIFVRSNNLIQGKPFGFLFGIAPNFGVALLLPMLVLVYYPLLFKKEITKKGFYMVLLSTFMLLFFSEVIHDRFLGSKFDINDIFASLLALTIMVIVFKFENMHKYKAMNRAK